MIHEWEYDRVRGKNSKGETPKHSENVIVHLRDGRSLPAWYDLSGWFRGMQGGFIYNVVSWESIEEGGTDEV